MRHRNPATRHAKAAATVQLTQRPSAAHPLATLRAALQTAATKPVTSAPSRHQRAAASLPAPAASPDDMAALFRQAVAGSTPLAADNRASIQRPAPLPTPRASRPEDVGEVAPAARTKPLPDADQDPAGFFRASIGEITPLADSGRVELDAQRRLQRATSMPQNPDAAAQNPTEVGLCAGLFGHADTIARLPAALPPSLSDPARLFAFAVGPTHTLPDSRRAEIERPRPPPRPLQHAPEPTDVGPSLPLADRLDTDELNQHLRPGLPRRLLADLRRGRWPVQGELDLHGMNRDDARQALGQFLHHAGQQGWRCLRLIHGRGLSSPGREAVLKHLARGWLLQRDEILAFCETRPSDGGDGALLLLLKHLSTPSTARRKG